MSYDNTNTGILTRNLECDESRNQPQYRGSMNVNGIEFWISAWVQEGKKGSKLEGQKYFSMKYEEKQPKAEQSSAHQQAKSNGYQEDQDIPF
jgi:hypothetical protein